MTWEPIALPELEARIAEELADCEPEARALYERAAIRPEKWRLPPWGDEGGGFWAVAVLDDRVLWFNDMEDGWNVSAFPHRGEIGAYWCNQDELRGALPLLAGEPGIRLGPPDAPPGL